MHLVTSVGLDNIVEANWREGGGIGSCVRSQHANLSSCGPFTLANLVCYGVVLLGNPETGAIVRLGGSVALTSRALYHDRCFLVQNLPTHDVLPSTMASSFFYY